MTLGRATTALAATAATVLAVVACGDDSLFGADGRDGAAGADAGSQSPDAGLGGVDGEAVGSASGVVIVHAAAFPAFRLCFEHYPELPPQPDRVVMPEANVVGVEVGSVVRIAPLTRPPGKVFVIAQRKVAAAPAETTQSCGELLDPAALLANSDYYEAGELTTPLGVENVSLLAIAGCGGLSYLNALGVPASDCGAGYDGVYGSLEAKTLALLPSIVATERSLPVQIVHLSTLLDDSRATGERLEVTFGAFEDAGAGALEQSVAVDPPLFDPSAPVTLSLDQTTESMYGTHGFRIARVPEGDGTATFTFDQSLAEVQQLSSPRAVPTTYYLSASNYVLLLLGDPRIAPTFADGGTNPTFDRRRAVHLLAVPVKEPEEAAPPAALDAGADDR
ncbi:MAG: hypothetical protein KF795_25605 [Labilithrix sp.]|nr:hypothetical protein [Labilithrix sp.]